jgi:hypothetical protein
MLEEHVSLSSSQRNETWVPAPLGLATIVSATQAIRGADRSDFPAVCAFALIGLAAVLVATVAGGPRSITALFSRQLVEAKRRRAPSLVTGQARGAGLMRPPFGSFGPRAP